MLGKMCGKVTDIRTREMDTIKNKSAREIQLSQQNACKNVDKLTDKLIQLILFNSNELFIIIFSNTQHEIKNLIKRWW